jgi:hypothetical protein
MLSSFNLGVHAIDALMQSVWLRLGEQGIATAQLMADFDALVREHATMNIKAFNNDETYQAKLNEVSKWSLLKILL